MIRKPATQFGAAQPRRGFTLIELLVVISILVLLMTMTVMAVNYGQDSQRVVGAALQVQSFLSGARDRAIHAKEPRGVRFFLDTNNHRAVTSMVYIDPAEYWSEGTIQLQRPDTDADNVADSPGVTIVAGAGTQWWQLARRGLLFTGLRIRIPKGPTGTWYTVSTAMIDLTTYPAATQYLVLQTPYADPGDTQVNKVNAFDAGGPSDYEVELPPRILPMDPVKLPENAIIDLDGSRLPLAWRASFTPGGLGSGNAEYSQYMDVVFSARGCVIGAASTGVLQFYICDNEDSVTLKEEYILNGIATPLPVPPGMSATMQITGNGMELPTGNVLRFNQLIQAGSYFIPTSEIKTSAAAWSLDHADNDPYLVRDRRLVALFAQTGAVSSHPVYTTDGDYDGVENDPMYFAETGRTGQ